jgi:hypothetical protein
VPSVSYQPNLDDGSDWSGLYETSPEVCELRKSYKRRLWEEDRLEILNAVLEEYWSKEQAAWAVGGKWLDKYFRWWLKRLRTREEACRWIEKVQWAKIY